MSVSISIFVCISVCTDEPLCTDMSRSPEAYPHTPTAYQTDLSMRLTMQVHMQQDFCGIYGSVVLNLSIDRKLTDYL